ncbi:transcriptional regulator, IclR family [Pseudovibrio denitrificans]|uniref:Transcriptional regulator, IclR family n=1 Tax=Pseudovibrio denitrificans TaxID=258256 RepID=A0A1I6XML3_9HYPH|nr:IclR family transcriptional regulator [Pseudovibrio denitrificans]SFT39396.1 transcriptional regulator, IclR family [Pseudovibrio denitrificans]
MQERLIQLLESVAGSAKPVSANDLAQMTKLPRATIYRNLSSLLDCGFLDEVDDGKRYVLGIRFVKIALTGKSDSHVIKAVMAMIHRLVIDIGETAFLARYRGGRVDLIHIETPSDPAIPYIYPGLGIRPAHACSSAKAIAAFILPELREELLTGEPHGFTANTLTDASQIATELEQVRRSGYALCDGEIEEGVTSVAVPINVDRLGSIFSMGVVGPTNRIKTHLHSRILPILMEENIRAAAAIQHCSIVDAERVHSEALAN